MKFDEQMHIIAADIPIFH